MLGQIAGILGRENDAEQADAAFHRTLGACNGEFWNGGTYGTGSQGSLAVALGLDLVPPDKKGLAVASLADAVTSRDNHLSKGNIGTSLLLPTLSHNGRQDLTMQVALQTPYPSWGLMLTNGVTTLWERWENGTGAAMNSHNHPMLGSVAAWLYRSVAGLEVAHDAVGSDRFEIHIEPTNSVRSAEASLATPHGTVAVSWRIAEGEGLRAEISVPRGTQAQVKLINGRSSVDRLLVGPGSHHLTVGTFACLEDTGQHNNIPAILGP